MSYKLFVDFDDDVFDYVKVELNNSSFGDGYKDGLLNKERTLLFNRLKTEYLRITKIKDYESVQKELYGNKSRRKIIEFELARIKKSFNGEVSISDSLVNIEKLLKMYDGELPNEIYEKIINIIIKLELLFDMRIGLFKELCCLFETENKKIL